MAKSFKNKVTVTKESKVDLPTDKDSTAALKAKDLMSGLIEVATTGGMPKLVELASMRTIKVPAGIGDSIWLIQKLINSGERFHIQLPDGQPQRGKQIWDLIPQLAASCEYVPGLTYKKLETDNIQGKHKNFKDIAAKEFSLSANGHLEQGKRIEQFFPDLPTSFKIEWEVSLRDSDEFLEFYNTFIFDQPTIGIYCSSYSTARKWNFWDENKWLKLIKAIHEKDRNYNFIIIGAVVCVISLYCEELIP